MRLVQWVGFFGLVVLAQAQPAAISEQLKDVAVREDIGARELYSRNLPLLSSQPLFMAMGDEEVCGLMNEHGELEWLEGYASRRSETLGKDGITKESVKLLSARLGIQLAYVLLVRLAGGQPLKRPCGFGHCHEGMCGDGMYLVSTSYYLADWLRGLTKEYGLPINSSLIEDFWVKSITQDVRRLGSVCRRELKGYRLPSDWPDSYDEYLDDCQLVIRAVHHSVPASEFKLDKATTERFMKLDLEKSDKTP